jgi:hypothetical protein
MNILWILVGGLWISLTHLVFALLWAITIIGIPVLLAWIPLFPIAAGLAILLGYLGVARNVGEWVAEQEYRGLEWIRGSNTFYTIVAGVGALVLPYVAVNVSRIVGFGFLTGLLGFAASMVTFAAAAVGLGAVLLTRGGKIRPIESYYDYEEDYWADMDDRAAAPSDPPPAKPDSESPETSEVEPDTTTETESSATSEAGPDSVHGPAEPEEAEWSKENGDHGEEEKEEDDANR